MNARTITATVAGMSRSWSSGNGRAGHQTGIDIARDNRGHDGRQ